MAWSANSALVEAVPRIVASWLTTAEAAPALSIWLESCSCCARKRLSCSRRAACFSSLSRQTAPSVSNARAMAST